MLVCSGLNKVNSTELVQSLVERHMLLQKRRLQKQLAGYVSA